ncbi:hypothetical protein C1645_836759 [Glomus cerebriforme]|uniref:Uncharacterized protein n=1 Tax=Glomus cerebriforme TaxID=658196 RepID=A0A397SGM5_9GLOM|nr:hypothetical protein C1645_836759 [Glomus cerebriforme]
MAGIATRYITENELNNELSIEEFIKSKHVHWVPLQPAGQKKGGAIPNAPDTSDNLQEVDPKGVKAIMRVLAETASNPVTSTSHLKRSKQCEDEGIHFPYHFSLELVKEKLDSYDVSNIPDKQALADDISQMFRSLEKNEEWAKQLLIWIQDAISSGQLKDPEKPRSVFTVAIYCVKNLSKAGTISDETLRHSPLIIAKKDKNSSYLSESSKESDSVKTIMIRENKAIPHKQQRKAQPKKVKHQKYIGELGITYHDESNSIKTLDASYFTLEKINLHISFEDGEKHKSTPIKFIVLGLDWPDYYPDLILGIP